MLDFLFVLLFAVVYPTAGYFSFQQLLRRIAAGERVSRRRLYVATLTGHWVLFGLAILVWRIQDRSFEMLGFSLEVDAWFAIATVVTIAAIAGLLSQLRAAERADPEFLSEVTRGFGSVVHLLPHTRREYAGFVAVAVTAGIVEEVLWRGFLIWYLGQFVPIWTAALISVLGFGLAHAYQGRASIPKITLVGAVLTAIFMLSGSLWLPIILHAAIDVLQGKLGLTVITRRAEAAHDPRT